MTVTRLTLIEVANAPNLFTHQIVLKSQDAVTLRPLLSTDVKELAAFLVGLSEETQKFSTFPSYDVLTAQEFCKAIAKYDKLRFVIESTEKKIVGLLEFSFSIPEDDLQRYQGYGITLDPATDGRFGPTLADSYQNQGLGSLLFPYMINIAKQFGKKRLLLYGGVLADNLRAIHFYQKLGFKKAGLFINSNGKKTVDMLLDLS